MTQLINNNGSLVYLGEETRTSKNDNKFTLVHIGDSVEMQRHAFFKDENCNTSHLELGDKVSIELNIDTVGYNQRINIKEINVV